MKSIGFAFNDFNSVINPFQFTGMDGKVTMIKDAITVAFKHFHKTI